MIKNVTGFFGVRKWDTSTTPYRVSLNKLLRVLP